jgi:hypothetical protein
MSKNHPHDNIYNILSKLKSLEPTPADVVKERAQQIRESVESQGSILKGLREISDVEQRLTRQFAESNFSKLSGKIQKSGKSKASADAISASIGREKLGQAEMTRRSVAGKKHAHEGVAENAKPDYIDLDKDGNKKESMKKASADKKKKESTNKSLAECAMCEAGTCTEHGVAEDTVHKGTYGTSYDPSDEEKKTKTKHVPKAGQKGRPKQDKPTKASMPADPFGRTTGEVPKGKQGTKIKGKGNVDWDHDVIGEKSKKESRINESVNFQALAKKHGMGMDECMKTLNDHYKKYQMTGECSDLLNGAMQMHRHHMEEGGPVPYEVPAVQRKAAGAAPLTPQAVQQQDAERSMHPPKLDAPKPAVYNELDELAKLAGITDEGNAYGLATQQTPPGEEIMIHGEPTGEIKHEDAMQDQAGVSLNELAKLAGLKVESNDDWHDSLDGEHENPNGWEDDSDMAGEEETTPGGNTFTYVFDENNNTTKFVYTDANGQSQSFEIYYDSTARGFDPHEVHDATDPKHQTAALGNQVITHDDIPEIIDRLIAAPTGVNEANAPVVEPDEEPINNAHKGKYQSMKASTMGPGEGDAGEKTMHPDRPTFKNGDNPLATPARNESTIKLEARLAREYESIKKKA